MIASNGEWVEQLKSDNILWIHVDKYGREIMKTTIRQT